MRINSLLNNHSKRTFRWAG